MAEGVRRHIGVLCSTIDIANQYEVWEGIVEVAAKNDIHLTAYIGTYQSTDNNFYSYLDACFDAAFGSDDNLDGVIILSGFIAQNIGIKKFNRYTAKIPKHIPSVSVSFELDGMPSIITHNEQGMFNAIDHLIREHGKKHIAFVKGPDGHQEAEARLQGYKDALKANGISYDEDIVFPGDFGRESGRKAVRALFDGRNKHVDAIACCNDQCAVGVLQVLEKRNIMVPDDLAVIGFDNDFISSIYVPALSTVGQDFKELGRVSTNLLIEQLDGKKIDTVTSVAPDIVPRQSCGCLSKELDDIDSIIDEWDESEGFADCVEKRLHLLLDGYAEHGQVAAWADIMLRKVQEKPFNRNSFLSAFDKILVSFHSHSTEFSLWHKVLIILAMGIEINRGEFEDEHAILSTLTYATTLVYRISMSEEQKLAYVRNDDRLRRRRNTNELLLMFDTETLAGELRKSIKELSMDMALIGIYASPVKSGAQNPDRTIKTLIGFDKDKRLNIQSTPKSPISFSDYSTFKGFDFERERRTMFLLPLFSLREEVGVMLLPYNASMPTEAYEALRINISTTLKGSQLMSTIQILSITDELTGLLNRRGFFQLTHSRLKHLQRSDIGVSIVMFIDMDSLKSINDNYGHLEGDNAIKVFSQILKKTMRDEDIIGRIGGDEFAVFSTVKANDNAGQLEERLRSAFKEYNAGKPHPYQVNCSIGWVSLEEATMDCLEQAMHNADNVLYEEKMRKKLLLSRN